MSLLFYCLCNCLVVVIAAIAAASTFIATLNEAHIVQDKQLCQTAHLISRIQARPITLAGRQRISGIRLDERIVVRLPHDVGAEGPSRTGRTAAVFAPAARRHLDGLGRRGILAHFRHDRR